MEAYQESFKQKELLGFDLRGQHSWDEVLRIAKDAENRYLQEGKGPVRKVGRYIADHSEGVIPYLRLIPNSTYGSVLCGGLKLIFEVRQHFPPHRVFDFHKS